MSYCGPAVSDFLVALDGAMGGSALSFSDCGGNTLINAAGGGRAFVNTKVSGFLL